MRRLLVLAAFLTTAAHAQVPANPLGFARDPQYFGGKIAFSFRGNIWIVNEDGANPKQLTFTSARDIKPRFSPDGSRIAFTSSLNGNPDIYVMPAAGGEPKRLTWHTANDEVQYWMPDGKRILFASSRGPMAWDSPLYTVSIDGDLPTAIEMGSGAAGMYSQDGAMLAFNRTRYPDPKRHYKGANNADVWVMNVRANTFTQLTDLKLEDYKNAVHDANPMWGSDGMIYYASERDGIFNIWKISPKGGSPTQVTHHTRGGVRFPGISPDGKVITYSNEFDIWMLPVATGQAKRVPIDLGYVIDRKLTETVTSDNQADDFGASPNGAYVAVDYHGEIFVVPTDTGVGEKRRVTDSEWRQHGAMYSPDGKSLAYLSDESKEEEVWLVNLATNEKRKLTTQPSRKTLLRWTADSKQIFFSSGVSVYSVDVGAGKTTEVARNQAGGWTLNQASPDGRWLVMTRRDDHQNSDVYLYDVTTKKEYNVTDHPARETSGMLTPDGKTVIFVSNREGGVNHLYSVALSALTEDPDDPLVKERRSGAAGGRGGRGQQGQGATGNGGEAPLTLNPADIDLRDIARRAVPLTRGAEGVSNPFLGSDGRTIYFVSGGGAAAAGGRGGGGRGGRGGAPAAAPAANAGTGPGLFAIDIDGANRRRIADGSFQGAELTADGRTLFFRENNLITKMPLTAQQRPKTPVRFSLAFSVDKKEEWREMFDEFYRYWKYNYVEEDMHGYDWAGIKKRYEPLVDKIGQTDDFYMLANEMLNELNSTHSSVSQPAEPSEDGGGGGRGGRGGAGGAIPPNRTQFLGVELKPDARGLKVVYIYKDGPADKPWLNVKVGDYAVSLNGTKLTPTTNYWKILTGPLSEWATLTVSASPDGTQPRELRIHTIASMNDLKYTDWVARNRAFVDSASGGKVAYFHMRAMNQQVLDQLKQEIDQYYYKQGMIIDVRYNGGGNIDQELMDVLLRRPYEYTWTKTGSPEWGRRPQQLIAGPQVMITNWRSNSNAEMVPHAFKQLGLGTVVGTPTNGAVVSAPNYAFLDGGSVRIPNTRVVSYDPTKPNNFGYNLENYGVPPNIFVKSSPEDEIKGLDRELLTAVQEAMRMLGKGSWQHAQN
ncbi:MAG TPA: S41 family peptidase [Gemmatimonadaceae bacterium]|nr:S41 family peptidase [Gemmatimonadaceae bacterium]